MKLSQRALATSIAVLVAQTPSQSAEALFSSGAFTSDATSGVSADKSYTAIANVIGNDVIVNGVNFAGSGGDTFGSNWSLSGIGNTFPGSGNRTTTFGGQSILGLWDGFQYNGNPGLVTFSGLNPGDTYIVTFYNQAWTLPDNRTQTVTTTEGATTVYNEDAFEASLLRYTFVATGASSTLSFAPAVTNNTYHVYGLSNERVFSRAWSGGSNWTTATWTGVTPNSVGSSANFTGQAAPTTINLDANITTGHLQFDGVNAWTVAGTNTLTLQTDTAGISVVSVASNQHTISAPFVLNSDVMKTGSGTLVLTNTVTDNGKAVNLLTGGINFASSASQSLGAVFSGAGSIAKTGGGTLTLTGTSTHTGGITIAAGSTVELSGTSGTLGLGPIANSGTLSLARTDTYTVPNTITGSGVVRKSGSGTAVLTGTSTYTGNTVVDSGTLRLATGSTPMLTDNFTGIGTPDTNNLNYNLAGRQTGSLAQQSYTRTGNAQLGNPTPVQQPSGTNGNYLLLAFGGQGTLAGMPLTTANVPGPLKITFDMFKGSTTEPSDWTSFTLTGSGAGFPIVGSGEYGFLYRNNTGIQMFNNGGVIADIGSTSGGDSFSFYLADNSGSGSAFGSNGARVYVMQGSNVVGSYALNASLAGRVITFGSAGGMIGGVDNLAVNNYAVNLLPATTNVNLNSTGSTLELEGVTQTVAFINAAAGSVINLGVFSTLTASTINGAAGSTATLAPFSRLISSGDGGDYAGVISGAGSVVKEVAGTQRLSGVNTYTGGTTVNGGVLELTGATGGTGNIVGTATVNAGGTLLVSGGDGTGFGFNGGSKLDTLNINGGTVTSSVNNHFYNATANMTGGTLTSTGTAVYQWGNTALNVLASSDTATVSAKIAIRADSNGTMTLNVANGAATTDLLLSGTVSEGFGIGNITKLGAGTAVFSGPNSYSGVTTLQGGILNVVSLTDYGVDGPLGNRAAGSDVGQNIGILFRGGTLQYTGSTPQETNRAIRISTNGGAIIDASGSVPAATLNFTAPSSPDFFENPGDRTLTLTGSNTGRNTFNMQIGQAGGITNLVKSGAGTWLLSNFGNSYSGTTTINGGTLLVNGSISGSATTVNNGGTLAGSGTAGPVTVASGGTLAPGDGVGFLNTGSLALQSGGSLSLQIDGIIPGVFHDQLNVTGTVDLGNGTLSLTIGGVTTEGDIYYVLRNDDVDAITGTFNGLSDGAFFSSGATLFQISYDADADSFLFDGGNDIALKVVPEPGAAAMLLGGLGMLMARRRRR